MPVTYTKVEKITDAAAVKEAYKPTHPGLFEVVYAEGDYNSKLVACKSYAKGEVLCKVEGITPGPKKYTSVQIGKNEHIELNSDRKSIFCISFTFFDLHIYFVCVRVCACVSVVGKRWRWGGERKRRMDRDLAKEPT